MHEHQIAKRALFLAMVFSAGVCWGADLYKKGETWVYQHQGPRPNSNPRVTANGDRVHEVIAVQGEGADRQWIVRETWGKDDPNPSRIYINTQKNIVKLEAGPGLTLQFSPALPGDWRGLQPGETKTVKTTCSIMGMDLQLTLVATRLPDQAVTVPAGEFKACRHIEIITHSTDPMGNPTKSKNEYWFHDRANGYVKDVFIQNYQSQNNYTGTSMLKSYTRD